MHGQVSAALEQRLLHGTNKHTNAQFLQRRVRQIAYGLNLDQLGCHTVGSQPSRHPTRLPEREVASPSGDAQR
jgi:hypothetical protein